MVRLGKIILLILALAIGGVFLLWATSPDPRLNVASFEQEPLDPALAPLSEAVTLAQVKRGDGSVATLLVTELAAEAITAVDLSRATGVRSEDPFAVLAAATDEQLRSLASLGGLLASYPIAELLPAAPRGDRHIGTGTNFPEHAEEAASDAVFQFPKFGAAMGTRSNVAGRADVLLDYEVELCMRFDRPIASRADFDAAAKGLFLCGDFTDRSRLIRLIDPDNLDSGRGFSDGKSREDFYPAGALLVVPRDWQSFVAQERMMTFVNGEPRQDARGGEMTLDFGALAEKALADMQRQRFLFEGRYYKLAPQPAITPDMTLMSGTAEGVIFTQPTRGDIIEGGARWLLTAGWARGEELVPSVIETFIANEFASGHFLQPGDVVEHRSARLGDIRVEVTGK
ncbi:fumarylacetoacetate hydrolase family protein [Altererythrobacter arenosus]|uniref:Fumarylacetoacetate hydrolase family protein n=1 Tax=Altererythrobacter arenosus TaxID=3032592 RepID=A0ABY8FYS0_9SPHN|nr:fumarylacetoacetate hydrolase family protein [Altererythrobacter sp. CAU 1644]WFL78441.1 fumarylacetoacetate hydrolase family protein [Altererythrobacter sp. CAU 1644]